MKNLLSALCTLLAIAAFGSRAQTPPPQTQSADPYLTNRPGQTAFPLAAAAGVDSKAKDVAPPGAVNQGPFNPSTWKYGPAFGPPDGAKIWNPVKLKMQQGGKVTGGTLFSATDPATYCAMADAGYDFIWTEMQHDQRDWQAVARMWRTCPNAKAVPGVRVAYTDEREIQHALDAGALVIVVPTVDSAAEAIAARDWTYFPPRGRRSAGGGQAFESGMWGGVAWRLSQQHQRQRRADSHDRDARRPAARRRDREGPGRGRDLRRERGPGEFLWLTGRARPITSARSTSSMTPRSRRASGCAVRSPGATAPISRVSRRGAKSRRLLVAPPPSSGSWRTPRASPRWGRSRLPR